MPTGIILSSGSVGAKQEDIEKVLTANGYEPEKAEAPAEEEPKEQPEVKAEAEEVETEESEKPSKPSRFQRRVERETQKLRDEIKQLREQLGGKKEPEPQVQAARPRKEDFKSEAEYEDALYTWRRTKEEAETAQKSVEAKLAANFEDYKASVADFKDDHDDWDDVVNEKVRIPESVYYAIVELGKDGPPVSYHLGQHPEVVSELAELTPYRAAIEIGRLADKLKAPAKKAASEPTKPKPKLPEPVKPVGAAATSSTLTSAEAAKARDFRAFKAAQRNGR